MGDSNATFVGSNGRTLTSSQIVDAITRGTPINTVLLANDSASLAYPQYGDIAYRVVPSQGTTISVSGGAPEKIQIMRILIQQPYTANCEVSWDAAIKWTSGAPFVDSRMGAVCCVEIMWDGMSTYYGRVIFE